MADSPPALDVASTALFVELVVVGCGTAAALSLATGGIFGWAWLRAVADAGPLVVAALAGVYVLGIVADRVADRLGEPLSACWRGCVYRREGLDPAAYDDDLLLILHDAALSSRLDYGRSRLRVVRGWSLNVLLAMLALIEYLALLPDGRPVAKLGLGLFGVMLVVGAGCIYAWWRLAIAQFDHVASQAAGIRAKPVP